MSHFRFLRCWLFVFLAGCSFMQLAAAATALEYQPAAKSAVLLWGSSDASPRLIRDAELGAPSLLTAEDVLIVPARFGEQFRIRSSALLNVGWGAGAEALPDAISWERLGVRDPIVRLSTWGSARFLVVAVATSQTAHVSVERAAPREFPMQLYRLDRQVYEWLASAQVEPPATPNERIATRLRRLANLRRLLYQGAPETRPETWASHWLQSRWLRDPKRSLRAPFFRRAPTTIVGTGPAPKPSAVAATGATGELRNVGAGEALRVHASGEDVVTFAVSVRAMGRSVVQLWSGAALLDEVVVATPRRSENPHRWTIPKLLRATPCRSTPITLRVIAGQIRVKTRSYRAESGLLDPLSVRHPCGQVAIAKARLPEDSSATHSALRTLLSYEVSPTSDRLERLYRWTRDSRLSEELQLLLLDAVIAPLFGTEHRREAFVHYSFLCDRQPAAVSGSLRRAAYQRLIRVVGEPISGPGTPLVGRESRPTSSPDSKTEVQNWTDQEVAGLLFEQIWAPTDGWRPLMSALGEKWAAQGAAQERSAWAKGSWKRAAPWHLVQPEVEVPRRWLMRPPGDASVDGLCSVYGSRGLRWTLLNGVERDISVALPGGTHALIRWLSPPESDAQSSEWRVGDSRVRVHAGLGASYSAIKPGRYRFSRQRGGDVLARIPRTDSVPCEQLREVERWVALEDVPVNFSLPGGSSPTVLSIEVAAQSLGGRPAKLKVELGSQSWHGQVRPTATGALEFPVAARALAAKVSGPRGTLIRVRVRRHRDTSIPQEEARSPATGADVPSLARLAAMTGELRRAKTQREVDDVRLNRAKLLRDLGYPRYANLDVSRRAASSPALPARASDVGGRDFVKLNEASTEQAVVLRGLLAKAPLLPSIGKEGRKAAQWKRVRRLRVSGRHSDAVRELTAMGAAQSVAVDALALALSSERAANYKLAAETYWRLAESTDSGALYARAARAAADTAAQRSDLDWARRAYFLARTAAVRGEDVSATLARFSHGLSWETLPTSGLGLGRRSVDILGEAESELSMGARLRRALTLAPAQARHFRRSLRYSLAPWKGQALRLEHLCFSDETGEESCHHEVEVDGQAVSCLAQSPRLEASLLGSPALPQQCEFEVPAAARTLSLRASQGKESFGWASLSLQVSDVKTNIPARRGYAEISADAPLRILLAGPAVVALQFRSLGEHEESLEFLLSEPAGSAHARKVVASRLERFKSGPDPLARWPGRDGTISKEQSHELVLEGRKTYALQVTPRQGRVLIRVRLARVDAVPRARAITPAAPKDERKEPSALVFVGFPTAPAHEGTTRGLLSYSLESAALDRDLSESEGDAPDRFFEQRALLRREIIPGRWWAAAEGFARLRAGPESWGGILRSQVTSRGAWPGGNLRAQWVGQRVGKRLATATRLKASAYQRYPLSSDVALVPSIAFTMRSVDTGAQGLAHSDRDVYSYFARTRPRSGEAGVALQHRLFADTSARYGLRARLGPNLDAIDQLDLLGRWLSLPGQGFAPWLQMNASLSYRPANALRSSSFVRWSAAPSATFWNWVSSHHRLRAEAKLNLSSDLPGQGRARLFGRLLLGYDYVAEPGLSDYAPSEKPFRQRLEEGAPRAYYRAGREDGALVRKP